MKIRKIITVGLAVIASLFLFNTSSYAETETVYVTAEYGLNIRKLPNTNQDPVDVVPYGSTLELVCPTNSEEWSCVLYQDRLRFVHNDYISTEEPAPLPEPEPVPVVETPAPAASYAPSELMSAGVIYWNGWRWTWYSQRVLPGGGLNIPGRHVDGSGYVCDGDGYICLACGSLGYRTVVSTPFGKSGKVYDFCETGGTLDVYVDW